MTISASTLRKLVDAGVTGDMLVSVVEIMEAESEGRRAKARDKKRRQRELSRGQIGTERDSEGTNGDTVSPKERSPLHPPKEITPSLSSEANASSDSKRTPADELAEVLDRDHAEAVVAHRKAMGKKLTTHAARLLAAKFAKAPDPNAGADQMIASGWQGFDAAWMTRATGPPGGRSQNGAAAATLAILKEIADEQSHDRQWAGHAGSANSGATPDPFSVDQWRDGRERSDGPAARQGDQRGRTPGHGGPVIDLEAIPRRA